MRDDDGEGFSYPSPPLEEHVPGGSSQLVEDEPVF